MEKYEWTYICVEKDNTKYVHTSLYHSFGARDKSEMHQVFFKFYLERPVKHTDAGFAISVLQQGDRLKHYRLGN
jgi:hypothetical protein